MNQTGCLFAPGCDRMEIYRTGMDKNSSRPGVFRPVNPLLSRRPLKTGIRAGCVSIVNAYIKRDKFDFEIGYLVKSPCKGCADRAHFPRCLNTCEIIQRLQTVLASGVSCSLGLPAAEPFPVFGSTSKP